MVWGMRYMVWGMVMWYGVMRGYELGVSNMVLVWYWYGTGMVLVWYWYGTGMVLVWYWGERNKI